MEIDWASFTPVSALIGGVIIGIATAILLLFTGRIAGISGIVGGLFKQPSSDTGWRITFVAGLLLAPILWQVFSNFPPIQINANDATLALAGFIVGMGTRYGSGCTSGHGVCGISRLSPRSIVATALFITTGVMTVYFMRHFIA